MVALGYAGRAPLPMPPFAAHLKKTPLGTALCWGFWIRQDMVAETRDVAWILTQIHPDPCECSLRGKFEWKKIATINPVPDSDLNANMNLSDPFGVFRNGIRCKRLIRV